MSGDRISAPLQHAIRVLLLVGSLLGCSQNANAKRDTVVILGAASVKDLLNDLVLAAKPHIGPSVQIDISTGPSHALAQQILKGAPADIYVSANRKWADEIVSTGQTKLATDWLANSLVVVVPVNSKQKISVASDLKSPEIKRLAVAGENVPAGIYAKQALTALGQWDALVATGKLVHGHDVRSTLAYAERGEVDAAIVYRTDAMNSTQVKVVTELSSETHDAIVYPLVRLQTESEAADRLYAFLSTPEADEIVKSHGFRLIRENAAKD